MSIFIKKELKGENEAIVEYGNDFINCKINSA